MPIYDYHCPKCDKRFNDIFVHSFDKEVNCPECVLDVVMTRLFVNRVSIKCWPAEGIFLEHVGPKGKRFFSEKEMKSYAKKHDLELSALL